MDGAGQRNGTCQQEGAPQRKIAAVSGAGAGTALDEDDLDGMGSTDILKGVGLHRANALAVDLDVGDSIALIRGDGEGLITTLTDADIAGGRNRAASSGSCLDGVVAVAAAATASIAACAAIAQNRQRVSFSTDSHDNVGFAAVGDGNGCAAAGGQSLSVDAHGLAVSMELSADM